MTAHLRCPFCSSEKVYCLLNTLHCKRCKNMWKGDTKNPDFDVSGYANQINNQALRIPKKTDTLETRMEKRLNEYLNKIHGKFCMDTSTWKSGDISKEVFMRYLKICVNNKVLAEEKDRYGRTWYSGTNKSPANDKSGSTSMKTGPDRFCRYIR
jgi:hypothetical protein